MTGFAGLVFFSHFQRDFLVSFLAAVWKGFLRAQCFGVHRPPGRPLCLCSHSEVLAALFCNSKLAKGCSWTSQPLKGLFSRFPLPLCVQIANQLQCMQVKRFLHLEKLTALHFLQKHLDYSIIKSAFQSEI